MYESNNFERGWKNFYLSLQIGQFETILTLGRGNYEKPVSL